MRKASKVTSRIREKADFLAEAILVAAADSPRAASSGARADVPCTPRT
jgi:hypothetical protein